jgi:hypothetical protein
VGDHVGTPGAELLFANFCTELNILPIFGLSGVFRGVGHFYKFFIKILNQVLWYLLPF